MRRRDEILIGLFWFVVGLGLVLSTCSCQPPPRSEHGRIDCRSKYGPGFDGTFLFHSSDPLAKITLDGSWECDCKRGDMTCEIETTTVTHLKP